MASTQLDKIEELLQSGAASQDPDFKLPLHRLASEIKDRLRKGSLTSVEFFSSTVHALSRLKGTAHAEVRMSCLLDCGVFLYSNGYGVEALEATRELEYLARRSRLKGWRRKAANLSGIVNADLGSVADAVIHYSEALALAREIGSAFGECSVLNNLGIALNYGGLYREAIPCLQRAAELSRTDAVAKDCSATGMNVLHLQCASLDNLAQSHLYLGEFSQGFITILEALERSEEPFDSCSSAARAVREFTFVQLALELGKFDLARTHSERCTLYGNAGGRQSAHVAELCRGLCDVYCGDVDRGLTVLQALLKSDYDVASARMATLDALVKAYELVGAPERALECMDQLLGQMRSTREQGVLALLSMQRGGTFKPLIATESDDLRTLTLKAAQLRARVAENAVLKARVEMLERLAVVADLKEEASGEHGYRVGKLSSNIAKALNWTRGACGSIELAARLHDIGKTGVPDRILQNSLELQDAERHFVAAHAVIGAELLAKSDIVQLRMAEEIARFHHEWWNGAGYPNKLAGKRIPLHARIVALCDVFDALTHGRPYADPWPVDRALEEIRIRRGTQFDPELTDLFLTVVEQLRNEHVDLDAYLGKAGQDSPFLQARHKIKLMLAKEREEVAKAAELEAATVS